MALDFLGQWQLLLTEFGDLGEALCAAIEANDVVRAISAMFQCRRVLAALDRTEAPLRVDGSRAQVDAILEVSAQTLRAQTTKHAMRSWLERPVPGDAALLGSPLGVAVLADLIVPITWDADIDVVVLLGASLAPVAEILAGMGQSRLVLHGVVEGELPPGVITTQEVDEIVAAVRTMTPVPPSRLTIRAEAGMAREEVEAITEKVRDALSDLRIHRNTVQSFSQTWIEQGTANLPALARWPSIAGVGERFAGKPMIIAAPGPSLARNVDQLRALKGRAIITGFSHSLKPLLAAGVIPDLVVTVDPQDVRYHFAGCDASSLVALVNGATVHPALYDLGVPRCLTLSANSAIDDWIFDALGEEALAAGGGSVATTAYSVARRWRCDPVIFVGLDLSFPGGQYYVSTSHDGGARAVVGRDGHMRVEGWSDHFHAMKASGGPAAQAERTIELPGWHGGKVPSSFMFSMFHRWFVETLAADPARGTVYNCTEGGAFIDGMVHRPLAEVAATLTAPLDVAAELDAVIAATDSAGRRARLVEHLTSYARGLRRSGQLAEKASRLARRAGRNATAQAELGDLERELTTALRPLAFASMLAQRQIERAQDAALRAGEQGAYLDASVRLFDTLVEVVAQLEPTLRAALARLQDDAPGGGSGGGRRARGASPSRRRR